MAQRILRSAAVGSSIALAAFVIVRAQSGCDSAPSEAAAPAATPTAAPASAPEPTPAAAAASPEPDAEPAAVPYEEPAALPDAERPVGAEPEPAAADTTPKPKPKRPRDNAGEVDHKFFPASKSGIDFGHQKPAAEPTQQAPQSQQANAPVR